MISAQSGAQRLADRIRSRLNAMASRSAYHRPITLAGRETLYRRELHNHLAGSPAREIDFFVNARRFDLMNRTLGAELARRPLRILNAASGPFALEFYNSFNGAIIDSFDIDNRLIALHEVLTAEALIAPCSFRTLDVAAFEPGPLYDIVLVNDLFYSKHVDFDGVIGKFAASVAPGGVLYFDIQDERAGPVWHLLGKGNTTRRYSLANVQTTLEALGFTVESVTPSLGIKGGMDGMIRRVLWSAFGIANNFAFVAKR
jgi:hypothetical protein